MDNTGRVCATSTTCGFVGPIFGGSSSANGSLSTGTVTPGSIWQFGGIGSAAVVVGGKGEVLVGSDGSVEIGAGGSLGFIGGGALMACRKVTTEVCNSK